ncbi:MAG: T9SS type A sorting domain-containing protein, partial [Bacteroidota bacterium]
QDYTLDITPTGPNPSTITIDLPANRVTDSGGNQNTASNTLSVLYSVSSSGADLELTMTVDNTNFQRFSYRAFTATLVNKGPQTANNVTVAFPIPTGNVLEGGNEYTATQGTYDFNGSQTWTVGSLAPNDPQSITISVFILQENPPMVAWAEVATANPNDPDATPGNGTCCSTVNEDDEAIATVGGPPPPPQGDFDVNLSVVGLDSPNEPFIVEIEFAEAINSSTLTESDFNVTNGNLDFLREVVAGSGVFTMGIFPTGGFGSTIQLSLPAGRVSNTNGDQNNASNVLTAVFSSTYCPVTTNPNPCLPDANAGLCQLGSNFVYDPADPATLSFKSDNPSPYSFSDMIGIGVKSTSMDQVYTLYTYNLQPDATEDFILDLSSHVRSFHFINIDYGTGLEPRDGPPAEIGTFSNPAINSLMERYAGWKGRWASQGRTDIDIIASLQLSTQVNGQPDPYSFPTKLWTEDQWGNDDLTQIYNNAKDYGFAFAEASCSSGSCYADFLEVGNEAWQYEDPVVYREINRGMLDGVAQYFNNTPPDTWPMKVMPGAFQAFRPEGLINLIGNNYSIFDHIGARVPCDKLDATYGISVHPYSFQIDAGSSQDLRKKISNLTAPPESDASQFQFIKNLVYWRNKNIPNQDPSTPGGYRAKIYVSEFGYDSAPNAGAPHVGEFAQGLYLMRSILLMARIGIYHATIYEAWDDPIVGQYNSSGLYEINSSGGPDKNKPKVSFDMLKNFRTEVGDQRFLRAINDGDNISGTNLYAYVLSSEGSTTPEYLVVWNGTEVADAQGDQAITDLRNDLTNSTNLTNVSVDVSSILSQGLTISTGAAEWLHDLANTAYTGSMNVSGNNLNVEVSSIPVLIPISSSRPAPVVQDEEPKTKPSSQSLASFGQIKVYPNPATDLLSLSFESPVEETFDLRVINALGQEVFFERSAIHKGFNELELNIAQLAAGAYHVQLHRSNGEMQHLSFVKVWKE